MYCLKFFFVTIYLQLRLFRFLPHVRCAKCGNSYGTVVQRLLFQHTKTCSENWQGVYAGGGNKLGGRKLRIFCFARCCRQLVAAALLILLLLWVANYIQQLNGKTGII